MMEKQTVWVDASLCKGCGACLDVCPVEAVTLVDNQAYVEDETCIGCQACVGACPEGAIQPVVQGEILPAPKHPSPAIRQPSPLAETAGTVAVAAGAGLLVKAGSALARAVERWLTQPHTVARSPAVKGSSTSTVRRQGTNGRGRRTRRRRRGG